MTTFTIVADNNITALPYLAEAKAVADSERFTEGWRTSKSNNGGAKYNS